LSIEKEEIEKEKNRTENQKKGLEIGLKNRALN